MNTCDPDPFETESLLRFLSRERKMVPSFFDFKHRLRNYGYCIKRSNGELFVHALPHRDRICALPRELIT